MSIQTFVTSFPRHPEFAGVYNDFTASGELSAYTTTQISSGTATHISTNDASANGIIRFSSVDATENKGAQIQQAVEPFQFRTGKITRFSTRFQANEATESDIFSGLIITDTSIEASAPSDGIYFRKIDGSAVVYLTVRVGSVTVADWPIATLAANTFTEFSWEHSDIVTASNTGRIRAWRNGVGVLDDSIIGIPFSEALCLSHAFQSGAAAIQTCDLDALGAFQTR